MKNPFDDDPLHHNNPLDISGNHSYPNPHDGFQSHDPAFQDNSHLHDLHHDPQDGFRHHDSVFQDNGHLHDVHHDPLHSEWANHPEHPNVPGPSELNDGHHEHHAYLHQPETPGLSHSDWTDSANVHPLGDFGHPLQTDWTNPLPDAHQHSHDSNWTPQPDHHTFGSAANSSVLHFESSSDSNKHPYITVSDSGTGHVYLNGDKDIGHIDGHTVYNSENWNCGHWETDGNIYDRHNNLVGWVHPDGCVYAKGSSSSAPDLEVYQTDKGVAGGAAYLLLVWCGGQTHI